MIRTKQRQAPRAAAGLVDPAITTTRAALAGLFGPRVQRAFAVRFWDGTVDAAGGSAPPSFTLVLRHQGALRRMLVPPGELRAAEAFIGGDVDVEGNLEAAAALGESLRDRLTAPATAARLALLLAALPTTRDTRPGTLRRYAHRLRARLHTTGADRTAVRFHYDLGNDFYRLWLDRRMIYSCAYFPNGAETLEAAQEAKLAYICRKLRLLPGERLLDIGCGWGGLVVYAAQHFGVTAVGVTLSEPQAEVARVAAAAAGLGDRCRIRVQHYRDVAEDEPFDKVVSVGMVEHVGRRKLPAYFAKAYRLVRPGGLFLNHGIVDLRPAWPRGPAGWAARLLWRQGAFIERYIFPGGALVAPANIVTAAERAGFETRDIESLREHYALTLRWWRARLETRWREAAALVGEATCRAWRLYLAGCARQFAAGRLGLTQALLAKPDRGDAGLPLSRADLYG